MTHKWCCFSLSSRISRWWTCGPRPAARHGESTQSRITTITANTGISSTAIGIINECVWKRTAKGNTRQGWQRRHLNLDGHGHLPSCRQHRVDQHVGRPVQAHNRGHVLVLCDFKSKAGVLTVPDRKQTPALSSTGQTDQATVDLARAGSPSRSCS